MNGLPFVSSSSRLAALALLFTIACASPEPSRDRRPSVQERAPTVVSIVGTNDLHGRLERVAVLAGYVENLRAARRSDGGGVVLVDAGDVFQGTLESNLNEGAAIIDAYNALGYSAVAVGNHEFDFGPVGEAATAEAGDDPRGALKARAKEARFPLLAANVIDETTGKPVAWDNFRPATLVDAGPVKVGLIGVTAADTPRTTLVQNFRGLRIRPLAEAIEDEARRAREAGAAVVVVVAHAGGRCEAHHDPRDLSSCRPDEEIFEVARALPQGLVDVIVAGHTHAAVAHEVNGIAIIESHAQGRAFGRVDVVVAEGEAAPREKRIFPPQELCQEPRAPLDACAPGAYEGKPVRIDENLLARMQGAFAEAETFRHRPLGVELVHEVGRDYKRESPLGNLFADLMRESRPEVDLALTNAGGVRADLPKGPLTYGALFEAMPFDNRFAIVRLTGRDLERVIAGNLAREKGIFLVSGIRAEAACQGDAIDVTLIRPDGSPIADDEILHVATSDFLAAGGDQAFGGIPLAPDAIRTEDELIRDALADRLTARGGRIDPRDPAIFDENAPRIRYPGERPMRCH